MSQEHRIDRRIEGRSTANYSRRRILKGAAALGLAAPMIGARRAAGQGGEKVQLLLWHMEQPPNRVQQYQKVLDAFNASQDRIEVRQQVQNWEDIYQKATSAIQSERQPDLLFTIPDFTTAIKQTGAVQPVEDLVDAVAAEHPFLAPAVQPYRYDDHTWAVPLYGMVQLLWYRKDMFAAAGLDPNAPPRDWDQLRQHAQQLTADGKFGLGLPASKHLYTDQAFYSFMITNGGKELFAGDGRVAFNTPQNVETLGYYKELSAFSPPGSSSWTWAEPQALLNTGQLAMAIEKGQFLGPFEEQSGRPAADLGAAPVPFPPDGERGSIYYSNGVMLLTEEGDKREATGEFLRFLFRPENYAPFLLAEPGLFLPVTEDGDAPAWRDSPVLAKYPDAVNLLVEQSQYGYLFGFTGDRVNPGIGQISAENMLSQAVQRAIVEDEAPEAAVAAVQQMMEEAAGAV
ncbi:MAG: extracellular solute-binding protein [Chloroflexota bacterium]|nr:extracellular solute-binding protein [Chloroflexota bacterium]